MVTTLGGHRLWFLPQLLFLTVPGCLHSCLGVDPDCLTDASPGSSVSHCWRSHHLKGLPRATRRQCLFSGCCCCCRAASILQFDSSCSPSSVGRPQSDMLSCAIRIILMVLLHRIHGCCLLHQLSISSAVNGFKHTYLVCNPLGRSNNLCENEKYNRWEEKPYVAQENRTMELQKTEILPLNSGRHYYFLLPPPPPSFRFTFFTESLFFTLCVCVCGWVCRSSQILVTYTFTSLLIT